jgi:hypothetical protein
MVAVLLLFISLLKHVTNRGSRGNRKIFFGELFQRDFRLALRLAGSAPRLYPPPDGED